jgi:flagellar hook-basal body complex protein FliE
MLQMRSMQMEAMGRPQAPTPMEQNVSAPAFDDLLKNAVDRVSEMQKTTSELQTGYERGDPGIDLTEVMIASQKSSVAFQAALQVRNKMVSAYESIMNMPI